MINLRTLQKLQEYAEAVDRDQGLSQVDRIAILSRCAMQALALVEQVAERDQGQALRILSEIESRG